MCRNYVRMDGWVQDDVLTTWHLHLAFSWETIPSEYKWVIWLDTYVQGWNRCATSKSPKPLPNEIQRNSKCGKLFNLKADGGTTNKKVHNQRVGKKRKRQANSCKSNKRTAKKAQKEHSRELSPAQIKRGCSGPGHMGRFVVVSLCDAWGLPQFSNVLHWLKTMVEDYVWRLLCLIMHDIMLKMCTV